MGGVLLVACAAENACGNSPRRPRCIILFGKTPSHEDCDMSLVRAFVASWLIIPRRTGWEIQTCEPAVVFCCGPVVGFGRFALVAEMAQEFSFAAAGDRCSPQPPFLIETDAFVAGGAPATVCVPGVLRDGSQAQIGLTVVETVVVDVIDKHIIGGFEHVAVHVEPVSFAPFSGRANRVGGQAAFGGEPFVSGKPEKIVRIDDSELALGQRYPAERIAVPKPPI